ncbi:MAG: transglycosylase family protein [Actinomycetota bacterium]
MGNGAAQPGRPGDGTSLGRDALGDGEPWPAAGLLGDGEKPYLTGTPQEAGASLRIRRVTGDQPVAGNIRLRQVVLLALMLVAGSLILVLPEPEDEVVAVRAGQDATITIGPDVAVGAQRIGGAERVEEGDELALAPENAGTADITGALVPEPDGVAFEALSAGPQQSTTTEPPESTTVPTTEPPPADSTATTAPEPTAAPATTAADEVAQTETDAAAADAEPAADAAADGEQTDGAQPETTSPDPDSSEPATSEPAPAETTVPTTPETAPPETEPPADPAFVDAGNGVLVPPVLLAIRFCESTDNYTAANPSSSARGAYQFLTGSWAAYGHKERYGVDQAHLATPAQQDEAALLTWQRDGTRPWNASKSCWSKRI